MKQREGLFVVGVILASVGILILLAGIEIWTFFGHTSVVITDLGYLGLILMVLGIIIAIAGFFVKDQELSHSYARSYLACPYCRLEISPGFLNCPRCGAILKKKCANCGSLVDSQTQFCPYCGSNQFVHPSQQISKQHTP